MIEQPDSGLSLKDDVSCLLTDPTFHDVTLVCSDGIEVGVRRAIVAARSVVFKAMLYGRMRESTSEKIVLREFGSNTMRVVLDYIHTEAISLSQPDLQALEAYRAASFFLLPKLGTMIADQLKHVIDLVSATTLLNAAVVFEPPNEMNMDLYKVLLKPFCHRPLSFGSLDGLSEKALEEFLEVTHQITGFKTPEHTLLLCVVEWVWRHAENAPATEERYRILQHLNNLTSPSETVDKVQMSDNSSRTMLRYIDLTLICPHRLECLTNAINILSDVSAEKASLHSDAAPADAQCTSEHLSRRRGHPVHEWDHTHLGSDVVISNDGMVVELPPCPKPPRPKDRTARITVPFMASEDVNKFEWDIVVESAGVYESMLLIQVGLVGEEFDKFEENIAAVKPVYCFESCYTRYGEKNAYMLSDLRNFGKCLKPGDIVT